MSSVSENCEFNFDLELLDHIKFFRNHEVITMLNTDLAKKADKFGTLLHRAALYDNVEIVQSLIESGINIDFPGERGRTALMIAVENERLATIKMLLNAGANIEIVDAEGQSVINMVFHKDYFNDAVVEAFVLKLTADCKNSFDINFKLEKYGCPPHHAIIVRDAFVIALLCEYRGKCTDMCNDDTISREKELHADLRQDITTMFVSLKLKNKKVERVGHSFFTEGLIFLPSKKTYHGIIMKLGDHIKEHGVATKPYEGYGCSHYSCQAGNENHFWQGVGNVKTLIAHLVMQKKLGVSIFKFAKCLKTGWYDDKPIFTEKYHELCQEILNKSMFQNSTLLDLLADRYDQIRTFVRNETFARIIEDVCSELQLSNLFPYYYKTLMIRIKRANQIVKLEDEAIEVISKIFGNSYNTCYHLAKQIVGYLNKQELERLVILYD